MLGARHRTPAPSTWSPTATVSSPRRRGSNWTLVGLGLGMRSQRYAMVVEDGVVTHLHVDEPPQGGRLGRGVRPGHSLTTTSPRTGSGFRIRCGRSCYDFDSSALSAGTRLEQIGHQSVVGHLEDSGASSSLLMATMTLLSFIPARVLESRPRCPPQCRDRGPPPSRSARPDSRWGTNPASTAAREAPTAAPSLSATSSRSAKLSPLCMPRPPEITIRAEVSSGRSDCVRSWPTNADRPLSPAAPRPSPPPRRRLPPRPRRTKSPAPKSA